jgi:hypothetical protein
VKVNPRADYPVGVHAMRWEVPPAIADLYDGIFEVSLNRTVDVVFVPDLSSAGPPFDDARLPRDLDTVASPEQARLASVLFAGYAVTPNDQLQGTEQRLPAPVAAGGDDLGPGGVVFFTTAADFDRYAAELAELSGRLGGRHPTGTIADLEGYAVVAYLRSAVLTSPLVDPSDLAALGGDDER